MRNAVLALLAVGLLASPARAEHSVLETVPGQIVGISSGGSEVVFLTATSLVPEDTDGQNDLYLSSGGTYELLTTGPTGGNGPFGVSPGGGGDPRVNAPSGTDEITQVYFRTNEALVAEDVDTTVDLYVHSAAGTALISTGPTATDGTPNYVLTLVGFSQSGDRIIFETGESLVAEDTDGGEGDVYERSGGTTTLVSTGPLDSPPLQTQFVALGLTPDASHVFFPSGVALTADDDDSSTDLYVRAAGVTTLVSNAPASSGGALAVGFAGTSDDGSRVFIRTRGVLIPADTDNAFDIYEMTPGGPVLTSTGPNDAPGSSTHIAPGIASADGSRYWFVSGELLVPGANGVDVYERSGGTTTLVSTGPTDAQTPSSVASLVGVFDGGSRVVFSTNERLVAADLDSSPDLYERSGTTTTLLSTGPAGGNGAFTPFLVGAAADGSRYFFSTDEQLTASDTDTKYDLYERANGATTHISYGPPVVEGGSYSSAIVSENGTPAFGNIVARIASGTYARPKGATPALVPLVVAFQQCLDENTNRTHGPPLAFPSCSPATRSGAQLVVGTPDFNGLPAKSVGSVRLDTLAGTLSTPADEADVRLTLSDTDIHKVPDLEDYDGEVQVVLELRITDKDGPTLAGGGPAAVTSQTTPLKWTAQCVATADATIGGTCAATTTADALVPGVVTEGRRSIWALEHVSVLDGGLDGDVETTPADNWLFQTQGLFVP